MKGISLKENALILFPLVWKSDVIYFFRKNKKRFWLISVHFARIIPPFLLAEYVFLKNKKQLYRVGTR